MMDLYIFLNRDFFFSQKALAMWDRMKAACCCCTDLASCGA